MKMATGNAVLKAYDKAVKLTTKDEAMTRSMCDAGFIIPDGQKRGHRKGYQVFVEVCRFSEERLKAKPDSGGLL